MPELPEVETIRIGLNRLIIGKQVESINFDNPKSFPNTPSDVAGFLVGSKVINIRRRAKLLMIDLSSSYSLVIHLKMTGQIVYVSPNDRFGAGHPSDSLLANLPDKSTRVSIDFKDKTRLFFNDQRKFGWMKLMPTNQIEYLDFYRKLGPEPLEEDFNWRDLKKRLIKRSKTAIKPALMDQSVLAGIGNIYADECLWGARIHPARIVGTLSDKNFKDLYVSIIDILTLSLTKGGSTDRNYVNAEGKKGSYLDFARVFRRQNLPCSRCGSEIIKIRLAGRGTHYCPKCQKIT